MVALKAKMYAFKVDDREKMTGKGYPKAALKKYATFDVYKHVLFDDAKTHVNFNCLRSQNLKLYIVNLTKAGLNNYDNKRYFLDNTTSLA